MTSLLLTSVGTDSAVALTEGLRSCFANQIRLLGADLKTAVACQPLLDGYFQVPRRTEAAFLPSIRALCLQERVSILWPLATEDQAIFSRNTSILPPGCVSICSSPGSVKTANDKIFLYEFSCKHGLPVPDFRVVRNRAELREEAYRLGYPCHPVVLKTAVGSGAIGLKILRADVSPEDMFLSRLNRDLTLERVLSDLDRVSSWPRMMLTEYLPGDEFSVDLLRYRGEWYGGVVRKRDDSIFGLATDATVVDQPDVLDVARRCVEALDLTFINNVQFRCSRDGTPMLMEINPRVPGTIGLSIAAGANLPAQAVSLILGEAVTPSNPVIGTRILRYFGGTVLKP